MSKTVTYYESAAGVRISRARAIREIERHCCDVSEFFADVGEAPEYDAQAVLAWLGY